MMQQRLDSTRVLVTGGGRGIGRAIALAMAAEGASVAVLARSGDQVDAVAAEIAQVGTRALAVRADLSRNDEIEAGIAEGAEAGGVTADLVGIRAGGIHPGKVIPGGIVDACTEGAAESEQEEEASHDASLRSAGPRVG